MELSCYASVSPKPDSPPPTSASAWRPPATTGWSSTKRWSRPVTRSRSSIRWSWRRGETGVLQGGNTLTNKDVNDFKDVVLKLGTGWSRFDLAGNVYYHDVGRDAEPTVAWGLSYRYRMTYDFTMQGELIWMDNDHLGVETRGVYVQGNIDLGAKLLGGADEEGSLFFKVALKMDAQF